ncbi:MAG: hypothetical protein GY812_16950 [Actinomycetia bacterium]|nr:hypothetical protein [Actinomycetes bacterium]
MAGFNVAVASVVGPLGSGSSGGPSGSWVLGSREFGFRVDGSADLVLATTDSLLASADSVLEGMSPGSMSLVMGALVLVIVSVAVVVGDRVSEADDVGSR